MAWIEYDCKWLETVCFNDDGIINGYYCKKDYFDEHNCNGCKDYEVKE